MHCVSLCPCHICLYCMLKLVLFAKACIVCISLYCLQSKTKTPTDDESTNKQLMNKIRTTKSGSLSNENASVG